MTHRAASILPPLAQLPEDQYRRLVYFVNTYCIQNDLLHQYGWGHLLFACYAALPARLSPDLLHKLRLNFRHYHHTPLPDERPAYLKIEARNEGTLEIPLVAVNDLLLSNLLNETGFEQFEMPEALRYYLLWLLQHSGVLKEKCGVSPLPPNESAQNQTPETTRLVKISAFLKRYADEHYTSPDPLTRSLREAQQWAAESWQNPAAAASYLRERLSKASKPTELYYYSQLGTRLGVQYDLRLNIHEEEAPETFQSLRTYAQGVSALYEGQVKKALDTLGSSEQLIASENMEAPPPGAVRLPVPREVAQELLKKRPELLEKPLGLKPRQWASLDARLRSPWPKAVLSIDGGETPDLFEHLATLERSLQAHYEDPALCLADFFDLIAGAAEGAVLATLLMEGQSMAAIAESLKSGIETIPERFAETALSTDESTSTPKTRIKTGWIRQYFGERPFPDLHFRNGLLIALTNAFEKEAFLTSNLNASNETQTARLSDFMLGATSTQRSGGLFSTYSDPTYSLNLSVIDSLLAAQPTFGWELKPERFLFVSVQADGAFDESDTDSSIRAQARWIERNHLALMDKYRMRVVQTEALEETAWPEAWRVKESTVAETDAGSAPQAAETDARSAPPAAEPEAAPVKKTRRGGDKSAATSSGIAKFLIVSAPEDDLYHQTLYRNLRILERANKIQVYNINKDSVGTDVAAQFMEALAEADYVLFLLSVDFLNSDTLYPLIEEAIKQEKRIIPIKVSPVLLDTTELHRYQSLPSGGQWLSQSPDQDAAYAEIVSEIRKLLPK